MAQFSVKIMSLTGSLLSANQQTSTTRIQNLCHAINCALTGGEGGEAYFILDDGDVSMKNIISGLAATCSIVLPSKSLPGGLLHGLAVVSETVWRTFNLSGEPPITRQAVMVMRRDGVLNGTKARGSLGYAPTISREEGLRQLVAAQIPKAI